MTHTPLPQAGTCWSARFTGTCAGALAALVAPAFAATTTLEPIVVVSTRTPMGIDRVSPSVSYIPAKAIESWQDQQLVDTINRQPGMALWSNGGLGSNSSLSIRGTESNHTALFIDGRRLSPGFGNEYDLSFLTPANASSVEIQRGPSSVQYGSSNIGGVIDTRIQSGLGGGSPQGDVFLELGSHRFGQTGVTTRAGSDRVGISLATTALTTDNERANDAFEQNNLTSRFDYLFNDSLQFELVAMGFENDKELPGGAINPTPFDTQETNNWLLSPGVRYMTDDLSTHLFYSRAERTSDIFEVNSAFDAMWNYLGEFPIRNRIEIISDEINLQLDYSLPGHSLLTVGTVFRNDDVSNSNISTYNPLNPPTPYAESFQQLGAFAQLLWMLGDNTELHTGVRRDDYSDFNNEITGNVMLIHHFHDVGTSLFAKAATSYAPPSAVDLAYDSNTSTALNAERSKSYELGVQQDLCDDKLNTSVVVFRNEIDDLLSYEPSTFDTFNIEKATTEGIETSLTWKTSDELEITTGYTYLRAVADRLNDPRTGGFTADPASNVPLARRPRHLVQFGATYQFNDQFRVGLQAIGQLHRQDIDPTTYLQREAEDFLVLRMVGNWQVTNDWAITARIENLLDESYSSAAGYPALGRTAYVGAKYSF